MKFILLVLIVLVLTIVIQGYNQWDVKRNIFHKIHNNYVKAEAMIPRSSLKLMDRSDISTQHEVIIAIKQNNLDKLDDILVELSTPGIYMCK